MATRAVMSVEEYLHTSFEGSDCEYLDGEVVERNMGELEHSNVQGELLFLLRSLAGQLGIQVRPEIRIQIRSTRFRVADVAVWRAGDIGRRIPKVPPFLAIEILSPEDRMIRVQSKIGEYLEIGVEYVWLIDPEQRQALIYTQQQPAGKLADVLATDNPGIEIPLESVLPPL